MELGGLHVLGTERHEARRIDNQLRGRCGRQGDPGSSRFYVSLGDDLMRLFGSDRLVGMMTRLGLEEGQVIEHPWVSRSIEIAQKRVEQHNFEIRKQLLEYDNVMNKQREVIYHQRRVVLESDNLKEHILEMAKEIVESVVNQYISKDAPVQAWDVEGFSGWLKINFSLLLEAGFFERAHEEIVEDILKRVSEIYSSKEESAGGDVLRHLERMVCLQVIDSKWKDHLYAMDYLREGIGLRAYGQRDPLVEYQRGAYEMFSQMVNSIKADVVDIIFKLQARQEVKEIKGVFSSINQEFIHPALSYPGESLYGRKGGVNPEAQRFRPQENTASPPAPEEAVSRAAAVPKSSPMPQSEAGRNEPCPCGSGKKYKKCCGK